MIRYALPALWLLTLLASPAYAQSWQGGLDTELNKIRRYSEQTTPASLPVDRTSFGSLRPPTPAATSAPGNTVAYPVSENFAMTVAGGAVAADAARDSDAFTGNGGAADTADDFSNNSSLEKIPLTVKGVWKF